MKYGRSCLRPGWSWSGCPVWGVRSTSCRFHSDETVTLHDPQIGHKTPNVHDERKAPGIVYLFKDIFNVVTPAWLKRLRASFTDKWFPNSAQTAITELSQKVLIFLNYVHVERDHLLSWVTSQNSHLFVLCALHYITNNYIKRGQIQCFLKCINTMQVWLVIWFIFKLCILSQVVSFSGHMSTISLIRSLLIHHSN